MLNIEVYRILCMPNIQAVKAICLFIMLYNVYKAERSTALNSSVKLVY